MRRLKMEHRARPSGVVLVEADATIVKGMLLRGDRQNDVAAWFGVNAGRIAEIAGGTKFWWVPIAAAEVLPPPGPYIVRELAGALHKAKEALESTALTA